MTILPFRLAMMLYAASKQSTILRLFILACMIRVTMMSPIASCISGLLLVLIALSNSVTSSKVLRPCAIGVAFAIMPFASAHSSTETVNDSNV